MFRERRWRKEQTKWRLWAPAGLLEVSKATPPCTGESQEGKWVSQGDWVWCALGLLADEAGKLLTSPPPLCTHACPHNAVYWTSLSRPWALLMLCSLLEVTRKNKCWQYSESWSHSLCHLWNDLFDRYSYHVQFTTVGDGGPRAVNNLPRLIWLISGQSRNSNPRNPIQALALFYWILLSMNPLDTSSPASVQFIPMNISMSLDSGLLPFFFWGAFNVRGTWIDIPGGPVLFICSLLF